MATAKLNVWVTEVGNPCKIDNEHQWFVHVLHCNGEILKWCGRTYTNLLTKCGHLETVIPPGCYMVCATWSAAPAGPTVPTSLGNHISHLVIVRADCGEDVCVTLFPPTFHWCGIWWLIALRENIALKLMPENARPAADAAVNAVESLLRLLPQDDLTKQMMKIDETRENKPKPPRTKN